MIPGTTPARVLVTRAGYLALRCSSLVASVRRHGKMTSRIMTRWPRPVERRVVGNHKGAHGEEADDGDGANGGRVGAQTGPAWVMAEAAGQHHQGQR